MCNTNKSRQKLQNFLIGLSDKYLPEDLRPDFMVTDHFMQRLMIDRTDNLNDLWISTVLSKVFRDRLCEFVYLLEIAPNKARINLQFEGRSVGLVKENRIIAGTTSIVLTTCFTGLALNPTMEYYVLSLDEGDE